MDKMKIFVSGVTGNVGSCIARAIIKSEKYHLAGGFCSGTGQDIAAAAGLEPIGMCCTSDLEYAMDQLKPDMVIDFTSARIIMDNMRIYAKNRINAVIGTTGFDDEMMDEVRTLAKEAGTRWAIISNFGLGMNFVMDFLKKVSTYYPYVSVIDRHHSQMANAPSGTAMSIAEAAANGNSGNVKSREVLPHVLGGSAGRVQILSQRMPYPGPYSEHEITLGRTDEIIRINVQDFSSEVYLPGIFLAADSIGKFPPGTIITTLSDLQNTILE